jgi:hypothetical protein
VHIPLMSAFFKTHRTESGVVVDAGNPST